MSKTRTQSTIVKQKRGGQLKQVAKVDIFLKEFLSNGGNATKAVMDAFDIENRHSAATMGSRYLKEAKGTARLYLENNGATFGKLLEIALEKAEKSKNPEWWDRLMKIAGYEDFMSKKSDGGVNVNILTAQKDLASQYITDSEVEEAEVVEV